MDLLLINFRKSIVPIIILASITVVIQVGMYNLMLTYDDAFESIDTWTYVCTDAVEFLNDDSVMRFNVTGLVSVVACIMIICFCGKEKEEHRLVIKNLPVKRIVLFLAKFIQVALSIAFIYCVNYAAMFLDYLFYKIRVEEEFRDVFVFYIYNDVAKTFLVELGILLFVALIISFFYALKNYRIKKGGKKNGKN